MERARGGARRADARGVRDDRGEPPDGVEPAAARRRASPARSASPSGVEIRHRRRATAATLRAGERGRGRDPRARASPPATSTTPRRTPTSFFDGWFRTGDRGVVRRRRLPPARGPAQGDDPPRRREHLAVRDRGGAARPSRRRRRDLLRRSTTRSTASASARPWRCRAESSERELIDHCRERLAAFKVPEVVHVLDAIPRTPTGKVQRKRVGRSRSPSGAGVRFAILGAGAIGAYVGAALARGGSDVTLDRPRRAPAGACRRDGVRVLSPRGDFEAHPAATGRHRRDRRRRRRLRRRSRRTACPALAPQHRRRAQAGRGRDRRRRTAFPGGTSSRTAARSRAPCSSRSTRAVASPAAIPRGGGDRLRHLLLDGDRRAGRHPPHRGHALRDRRARRRRGASAAARSREAFVAGGLKCPVESSIRDQIWLKLIGNAAFNPVTRAHRRDARRARDRCPRLVAAAAGDPRGVRRGRGRARDRAAGLDRPPARGRASPSATTRPRCSRTSRPASRSSSTA